MADNEAILTIEVREGNQSKDFVKKIQKIYG